ncbi:hypothetical protein HH304_09205 [Flammeovirgaceae bacterium KN852]|uniref:Uncharacterized protein n=2 Tax=Marinigracilibium pacificum TaxID=2729599 RepID=A0A848IZ62_9BACT|nr:hypothetical protein [Marinigracilibium pacificum]
MTKAIGQNFEYDSTEVVYLITKDNIGYSGKVTDQDDEYVFLQTEKYGVLKINKKEIKRIETANGEIFKDGQNWPDYIQATRYLISGNGMTLKKGQGYYDNILISINNAAYGVTDNLTLGIGLVPFFFLEGDFPVWINAKYGITNRKDNVNFSLGMSGLRLGSGDNSYFGILYGATTFGDKNLNFTVGLGLPFEKEYGFANYPYGTLSGAVRVSKSTFLMMESYFLGLNFVDDRDISDVALFTIGGKSGSKHISFNYGLLFIADLEDSFIFGIPITGITVPFGKK